MQQPLVSIIIPTYNRAHLIGETLESVFGQTYTNLECIVVDDGSTDSTVLLLKDYCNKDTRFKYHHRPKDRPKGANACRNYGFELSKGEYINWFDDDDLMHKNKLRFQIKALENSDYNFSVCQTLVFENSINNILYLSSDKIISNFAFDDYLRQNIVWLTNSALWKRKFLMKLDYLFDEELQAAQEWEFHCRVLYNFKNYQVINRPLVYNRKHNLSVTYNDNVNLRRLHYYKARGKIFEYLKKRDVFSKYLNNYFVDYYRRFLISKNYRNAFFCYKKYILFNKQISLFLKIKLVLAYFLYIIFKKGEFMLKG